MTGFLNNHNTISSPTSVSQENKTKESEDGVSLTPLVRALKATANRKVASFHFPGHNRGRAAPASLTDIIGVEPYFHDLTGTPGLGNHFAPNGPIWEAQKQAAQVFGASETWFLVGGTTCGIEAAIMATCSPGDYLILPRNCHISAISGLVLSGARPKYTISDYSHDWDISAGVSSSQVEKAMKELGEEGKKAAAVFVTSPTYHGICSNITEISKLCHYHKIPLIVDEAHGAHLSFHPQLQQYSALRQGADIVVQSTHKVLCSLSQSSMLHLSTSDNDNNLVDRDRLSKCLQTLQSTSPNHLLLASLDAATAQLKQNPDTLFIESVQLANETKRLVSNIPGITVLDSSTFPDFRFIDPLRLTFGFWKLGLSGYEAHETLFNDLMVVCELVGTKSMTFPFNLGTCKEHVPRLVSAIKQVSTSNLCNGKSVKHSVLEPFADINISSSPRDAFFARKRKVSIKESLGKVCGELICPYPPGIPVIIPGELITTRALDYLVHIRSLISGADENPTLASVVIRGASDPSLSSIVICDIEM